MMICFTAFYIFMTFIEKGAARFSLPVFDLLMYKSMVFHDVSVLSHDFKTCLIFYQALSTGFQFFINLLEPWVCRPFVYIQIFCVLISLFSLLYLFFTQKLYRVFFRCFSPIFLCFSRFYSKIKTLFKLSVFYKCESML